MLDPYFRPGVDRVVNALAARIVRAGVSANMLTLTGFALVPVIVGLIGQGLFVGALVLVLVNRLFDGLDGAVARLQKPTDFGGYLDIVLDFLFYAAVPLGFALYDPAANGLATSLVLVSFIGTGSSFLAYAILAAKRGVETTARGKKSFFHLGGLIEGSETIAFLVLVCLVPEFYAILAMLFALLCGLSTVGRIVIAYRDFG